MAADHITRGRPVADFETEFEWFTGPWQTLFDKQIELVKRDVIRAKTADKLVVYLSCPISARGGGYGGTNVDVALAIQRRLLERWGDGVWILNPALYQMESRDGTGLMNMHAAEAGIDLEALIKASGKPRGGDYMRMWTKVLVENDDQIGRSKTHASLRNTGQFFDAYYFVGPTDVHQAFVSQGETLTAAIEEHFARKMESDPDFRDNFSVRDLDWGTYPANRPMPAAQAELRDRWRLMRNAYLRYYVLRAGVNYSLGSHDEWNIFLKLNEKRRRIPNVDGKEIGGIGEQLAGFFDGQQIDLASTEIGISKGYAL